MNKNSKVSGRSLLDFLPFGAKSDSIHTRISDVYTSVKRKVVSLFEGENAGLHEKEKVLSSGNIQNGYGSSVKKFITKTSFVVTGILGGLAISQAVNAGTIKDGSVIANNQSPSHISVILEQKAVAEKNQKVIDTHLKKLLELQGMKGVLKSEGIPSGVTDYSNYIKKQDKSLNNILEKIRILQGFPVSTITTIGSGENHSEIPTTLKIGKNDNIDPLIPSTRDTDSTSTTTETPLDVNVYSEGSAPKSGNFVSNNAIGDDVLDKIYGNSTPPPVQFYLPTIGLVELPYQNKKLVGNIFPVEDKFPVASSKLNALPAVIADSPSVETNNSQGGFIGDPPSASIVSNDSIQISSNRVDNPNEQVIEKTLPPSVTPVKEPGLNKDTLTAEGLRNFLEQVDKKSMAVSNEKYLKGVSFSYKTVTVKRSVKEGKEIKIKNVLALRVFLKQGKHRAYATFPLSQEGFEYAHASRNFNLLSSTDTMIAWAKRYTKKWKMIDEKVNSVLV